MNRNMRNAGNGGVLHHPGPGNSRSASGERTQAAGTIQSSERSGARVFIGIKVAPEIAQELAMVAHSLEIYSVRLIRAADIHLTLVPPWNETNIAGAVEGLRHALQPFDSFNLVFEHLHYAPTLEGPKFLWAECAVTDELRELQKHLLTAFKQTDEKRPFRPHVTVARIRKDGRIIAREHPIDQKLMFKQRVQFIELFQSPESANGGYQVIASLPLRETADCP